MPVCAPLGVLFEGVLTTVISAINPSWRPEEMARRQLCVVQDSPRCEDAPSILPFPLRRILFPLAAYPYTRRRCSRTR